MGLIIIIMNLKPKGVKTVMVQKQTIQEFAKQLDVETHQKFMSKNFPHDRTKPLSPQSGTMTPDFSLTDEIEGQPYSQSR